MTKRCKNRNSLKSKNPISVKETGFSRAPCRNRTNDLLITSQLLYQLS
jgi:hypothetical protein